jgi:hypothetical protein
MKIIIFGSKRCKFCELQKSFLDGRFNQEDWMYVDVVKDMENLKIASSVNIDKLPTVVILDEKNKEKYRHEGTISSDKIFNIIEGKGKIPLLNSNYQNKTILSYDPFLKKGDDIKICDFDGNFLYNAKVSSCKKEKINNSNIEKDLLESYAKIGGRKDIYWIVDICRI